MAISLTLRFPEAQETNTEFRRRFQLLSLLLCKRFFEISLATFIPNHAITYTEIIPLTADYNSYIDAILCHGRSTGLAAGPIAHLSSWWLFRYF